MLDSKYSNAKVLKNHLARVRALIEDSQPALLQKPQIGREFVIELDRMVMDFCKNPPQNIKELENFVADGMLKIDAGSEVWHEMLAYCGRLLGVVRDSNGKFSKEEIVNALYFCRNIIALLINIPVKPPDFYEGGTSADKN